MFSRRTAWTRQHTPWAAAARDINGLIDLTCANPTRHGFAYPEAVRRSFYAGGGVYDPQPLGSADARAAICDYMAQHDGEAAPTQTWLGAGTSELYAQLMQVLGDPGDAWLVPEPGYPLLDYLADLTGTRLLTYPLRYDGAWHYAHAEIRAQMEADPGIRAVVLVSPHHPTGHVASPTDLARVARLCAEHERALIVDEVFLDYPLQPSTSLPTAARTQPCLTFTLSGLSKVAAFPQGKLSWGVATGPAHWVAEAMARLELIADTYLSVSPVLQQGLSVILREAPSLQERIRARCRDNDAIAQRCFADSAVTVLSVAAGWSALWHLPALQSDEAWSLRVLREAGALTMPGYLFGLDSTGAGPFLCVSLLSESSRFETACRRSAACIRAYCSGSSASGSSASGTGLTGSTASVSPTSSSSF
jgi:alanine-synthesizing transaminase